MVAQRKRRTPIFSHPRSISQRGSGSIHTVKGNAEGDGGASGVVLPLTEIVGTSGVGWGTAYSLPIWVGAADGRDGTQVWVQVDTGSSDLWIASSKCSSSSCNGVPSSNKYDPSKSSAQQAQASFSIDYLRGKVSGPIYWDTISIHPEGNSTMGYAVQNQAFAAAESVDEEPLTDMFNGILGLAMPLNSVINNLIPAGLGDAPDGAVFSSNLFGLTGASGPPSQRFISLSLSRPGSSKFPSLLGLGKHPEQIPGWENKAYAMKKVISYSHVLGQASGSLFWRSSIHKWTVNVNGSEKEITLPQTQVPHFSSPYPSAVYDSGIPLIFATKTIADAVYGAIGVSPASDGNYYLPCSTPLIMSFVLDGRESPILVHPLDMSAQNGNDPTNCIGLLQTFPAQQDGSASVGGIADVVLGTPFLRNVYMVMGMNEVDQNGDFNTTTGTDLEPRLGLLGLTTPQDAFDDWQRVRVNHQTIDPNSPNSTAGSTNDSKGLSVGIKVLIGLASFFGACILLFAVRWFFMSRRQRQDVSRELGHDEEDGSGGKGKGEFFKMKNFGLGGYLMTRRRSTEELVPLDEKLTEDDLRKARYEAHLAKRRRQEESEVTLLNGHDRGIGSYGAEKDEDWDRGSSPSDHMPLISKQRLSVITERDTISSEVDDIAEMKSMMTSAVGSAGHSPTSPTAMDIPPVPSLPSSLLAAINTSPEGLQPADTDLINTASDTNTSPNSFIPPGAAKPHTFFPASTPSRPISLASVLDPATFLQPDSTPAKKYLPSLKIHSPLMSSSDFLPRSAAPLTATSESSPARYSPPAVLQALPPATPSTATHTHEPPPIASSSKAVVGAPPKEVMGEFGVLSRSSTASTSNTGSGRGGGPGMAGVGAHKKEDSLGFVFNPEAMLVSPTLAIPASAPRGSLDDPETASGYGTSMYASEMLSPLSRSDSAEAGKPPSLHTLGGISEEGVVMTATRAVATPPKPLSFSAVSTAASSVVDSPAPPPPIASPPAVGVAMPRVRVQRPSGPRQSSASSMSWSGHGNDPPLS